MSRARNYRTRLALQNLEMRDVPSTTLLKDINTPSFFNSYPHGGAEHSGMYYFVAEDLEHGKELWRTDGTPAGTTLAADVRPGSESSNPNNLRSIGGRLYFTAAGWTGQGTELWYFDSNNFGPTQVRDINTGADGSSPNNLTAVNYSLFYFAAYTNAKGYELWKSDGTFAGTQMVKEINTSANNFGPSQLTNVNGTLYFTCQDTSAGEELWKSDGTAAGTVRIKDINVGVTGSDPQDLVAMNGKLYFSADDGASGRELWVSDGTAAGTTRVRDINLGANASFPDNLTIVNGTLYFAASTNTNGRELWKSDGTLFGTVAVADINPGAMSANPTELINVNGTLFFSADDGVKGIELWKSDGSAAGTTLVKDVRFGVSDSRPMYMTNANGTLYFVPYDDSTYQELWKSDGTTNGTVMVKNFGDTGGAVFPIGTMNGTLFMDAAGAPSQGRELWMTTAVRRVNKTAVGAGAGQLPQVRVYNNQTQAVDLNLFAYTPTFMGGVRVAVGDVTGDGIDDIVTAPGAGGGPHIRVFDGVTGACKKEFFAYAPNFAGGVFIAVGDLNKDGYADIITGAGAGGGPHVRVFNGKNLSLITEFFAFVPTFLGGVNVGAGDVNADGFSDLIFAAGPGGGPHVRVISGKDNTTELKSFFAYDASFTGGVNIAAGDLNGDGYEDLIVAQASNGQRVHTYSGRDTSLLNDFNAAGGGTYNGGVRVAAADSNHDGFAELLTAHSDGNDTYIFSRSAGSPNTFVGGFHITDPTFLGGIFVGA